MFEVFFLFATAFIADFAASQADDGIGLRIFGGSAAKADEFPYMVSLRNPKNDRHLCGGSIIDSRAILTSARCLHKYNPGDMSVIVGSIKVNEGTRYKISKFNVHPDYNRHIHANDIAIIITSEAMAMSSSVGLVALPSGTTGAGVNATLTGWGFTNAGGHLPTTLQKITLTTLDNDDCKSKFDSHTASLIEDSNICTFTKIGEGACYKDAGGPLVYDNTLVGLFVWPRPCAQGIPDIYTRISSYITWINNNKQP